MSGILCHWGVQLILASSWARLGILVAGKGRGGNVFISSVSSVSFLFLFLPCPSLSSPLLYLLCLFSFSLGDDPQWPTRVDVSLNPNTINQKHLMLLLYLSSDLNMSISLPVEASKNSWMSGRQCRPWSDHFDFCLYLLSRLVTWNAKSYFLWNIIIWKISMLSAKILLSTLTLVIRNKLRSHSHF